MRRRKWILCLWPGLPRLWLEGDVIALVLAIVCGALLQALLLSSFIWPGLASSGLRTGGWLIAGCVWVICAARSYQKLPFLLSDQRAEWQEALFREAQAEYLKGNWYQAEALLECVLGHQPGDVDSRLMLATLYRRVRRTVQAREQLRQLERYSHAGKWHLEICHEMRRLDQLEAEQNDGTDGNESREAGASKTAGVLGRAA